MQQNILNTAVAIYDCKTMRLNLFLVFYCLRFLLYALSFVPFKEKCSAHIGGKCSQYVTTGGIFFRLCIFLQKPLKRLKPKNITLRLNFEENSYFDAANEEFSNTSHKTTALILAVKSMTLNFIYGRFNFGWFLKFNTQVFYFNKKMNECLLSIVVQIFTQCMLQKWPRDHVR